MPGQTLSEIRGLLACAGLAPRHALGQNFLIDLNLMRKLVAAAELAAGETVLEVGPGTGSLTEVLLASGARVVAVEVDRGLQELLAARLRSEPRFTLVRGDALESKHRLNTEMLAAVGRSSDPAHPLRGGFRATAQSTTEDTGGTPRPPAPHSTTGGTPALQAPQLVKLVANLPYQIATPLLLELLHVEPPLDRMCVTIQREVGERLTAAASTDAYGPASVVMQSFADVSTLAVVPPQAFWPRPKVDSVMLVIRPRRMPPAELPDPAAFVALVQRAFVQRRKMLRRALSGAAAADALEAALAAAGATGADRPEALSPAQWRALHRALTPTSPAP